MEQCFVRDELARRFGAVLAHPRDNQRGLLGARVTEVRDDGIVRGHFGVGAIEINKPFLCARITAIGDPVETIAIRLQPEAQVLLGPHRPWIVQTSEKNHGPLAKVGKVGAARGLHVIGRALMVQQSDDAKQSLKIRKRYIIAP